MLLGAVSAEAELDHEVAVHDVEAVLNAQGEGQSEVCKELQAN